MTERDVGEHSLPECANRMLWFRSSLCGEVDYLEEGNPHTFPGRMPAWCPHRGIGYLVSLSDLREASAEAQLWARAFVLGNEPHYPVGYEGTYDDEADPRMQAWRAASRAYQENGVWPREAPTALSPYGGSHFDDRGEVDWDDEDDVKRHTLPPEFIPANGRTYCPCCGHATAWDSDEGDFIPIGPGHEREKRA